MTDKPAAKKRSWIWFNSSDEDLRSFLQIGIIKIIATLKKPPQKTVLNILRKTLEAVLAKDGKSVPMPLQRSAHLKWMIKKILIGRNFFTLSRDKKTFEGNFNNEDSQLLTLVHEVTHFKNIFHPTDDFYSMYFSIENFGDSKIRYNADSLAASSLASHQAG